MFSRINSFAPRLGTLSLLGRLSLRLDNNLFDASPGRNESTVSALTSFSNSSPARGTHSAVFASAGNNKAYIQTTNVLADISTGVIVCFYLKVTGVVGTGASVYFDIGTSATTRGIYLQRNASQPYNPSTDAMYNVCGSSGFYLPDNQWIHLAFAVTAGSSTIQWYYNGRVQQALTEANTSNYPSVVTSIDKVRFGSSIGTADSGLIGHLDDIGIHTEKLSVVHIAEIVARTNPGVLGYFLDPVVHFAFDTLDIVNDELRVNNEAPAAVFEVAGYCTLSDGAQLTTSNRKIGAQSLVNSTTSSRTRFIGPITLLTGGAFSIAFWINLPTAISATETNRNLFGWTGPSMDSSTLEIGMRLTSATASAPYTIQIRVGDVLDSTTFDLLSGLWYHIALTAVVSPTLQPVKYYVNGVLRNTITLSRHPALQRILRCCDMLSAPLEGGPTGTFMDDFRFYRRELSPSDLYALYRL